MRRGWFARARAALRTERRKRIDALPPLHAMPHGPYTVVVERLPNGRRMTHRLSATALQHFPHLTDLEPRPTVSHTQNREANRE